MDTLALERFCLAAANFYDRGYAFGSTGNLSVRVGDRVWITPTGKSLQGLNQGELACIDMEGATLNESRPSKEFPFHLAAYRNREDVRAIVHLHSTHAAALSCLEALDSEQPLPPLTPYFFMRVAPLVVLPYFRPGSPKLAEAVGEAAPRYNCMLLRNHGLICLGSNLNEAVDRAEELEETARLHFLLRGERVRHLTPDEIEELRQTFGSKH
ncbi:MAG TPA: aldolase [Pyrinomonadaceae bacterium]|jgi:ribulose-5-phosphate 4-epimerase/fuculose-1-phosphate aldolase|nr:aldolase [Pyrinomonadaceae bacterium]